jgi:hypothetical protein
MQRFMRSGSGVRTALFRNSGPVNGEWSYACAVVLAPALVVRTRIALVFVILHLLLRL